MTALGGGYERKPEERKRLIVNEQGEFVRPSDLQKTMGGPLFSPYSEEEEQEFLFDDDLDDLSERMGGLLFSQNVGKMWAKATQGIDGTVETASV